MTKTDKNPFLWDIPVALVLLTRLPLPALPKDAFTNQARAVWAFGLVGLVVGAIAATVGWLAINAGLSVMAATGLVLLAQIVTTGAMHEDGLADTADGLWGGVTPARRLEIMGDSRIGTYGVLALILSLGLRWVALSAVLEVGMEVVIAVAVLSRAFMPLVMSALPFARADGLSRAVGRPDWRLSGTAALVMVVLAGAAFGSSAIIPIGLACLAVALLAALANAKIGGQTGDILGASQQVAEIALLLGFAALA